MIRKVGKHTYYKKYAQGKHTCYKEIYKENIHVISHTVRKNPLS